MIRRTLCHLFNALGAVACLLAIAWAAGAICFDLPFVSLRPALAAAFVLGTFTAWVMIKSRWQARGVVLLAFALVLAWWLTLKPSNDRMWQPDVAQLAWAEVHGDTVTLHNVRNCDYRTETDFTPHWETRTVQLSQLTGIDLAINYWGSPWIAHPIASFQFTDSPPVCFSIETRKEVGESYSTIGGLYREYELIYVVADERDVIRVRTNYRQGEEVFLYHTTATPAAARQRFLEYVDSLNQLHDHPRWYNAITTNCTTSIRTQRPVSERTPWDWRLLLNGKGDELMYQRHTIATDSLPLPELKQRALINQRALAANSDPDFSKRIRKGTPGFSTPAPEPDR